MSRAKRADDGAKSRTLSTRLEGDRYEHLIALVLRLGAETPGVTHASVTREFIARGLDANPVTELELRRARRAIKAAASGVGELAGLVVPTDPLALLELLGDGREVA